MRIAKYAYSSGDLSRAIMLIVQTSEKFRFLATVTVVLDNRLSMRKVHLPRIRMMNRKEVYNMKKLRFLAVVITLAFAASIVYAAPVPGGKVPGKAPGQKAPNEAKPEWWGKAPGPRPFVHGTVENVSPQSIAVKTPEGVKVFTVNENTKVIVRGQKATISDVKVGDTVNVKFKLVDNNVPLALGIQVPKPSCGGQITAINNNMIILRDRKTNAECRVVVSDKTKYRSKGYEGTLADLKVGYFASATGDLNNGTIIADIVNFMPEVAKGTVIAVEGNVVTLKTVRQLTIPVLVSEKTVIIVSPRVAPDRKGTLQDIKVGTPANIGYIPVPNGPARLLWIDLLTGA